MRRGPDDPEPFREQPRYEQVVQPRQQLALGQVPGGAEQHDDVAGGPVIALPPSPAAHCFFSAWPPNSDRIADRIFPVNAPLSRDSNRWYRDAEITGTGTPSSTPASTVHRPSPESDTCPLKSSRFGDFANAAEVRSTSQEE